MMVLAGLAFCLSLGISSAAFADPPGGVQPPCADITDTITGASFLSASEANGIPATGVYGAIGLAAASCTNVSYTTVVFTYNARGLVSGVRFQIQRGDGVNDVMQTFVATPTAQFACVFFVTSIGFRVLDVAPDRGCPFRINVTPGATNPFNVLALDGGAPGGGFFN
jgi:hypothetical protein